MVDVPGARLRYRLGGTAGAPLLVFENGWGASYECWTWVERELAPHAQLLFYDRAGIGGSQRLAPQTVASLSAHFAALPPALGLQGPVIGVGHSYGGLMCSLHAAQCRGMLKSVIEIDPTPESGVLDGETGLRTLPKIVAVIKGGLRLGLPNLMFGSISTVMPPAEGRTLMRLSLNNPASLNAGLEEFALLDEIRSTIAARRPREFPRLLISAAAIAPNAGWLTRLLASETRQRSVLAKNNALQAERAVQDPGCRVLPLPYDHGALVFQRDGARAAAEAIRSYVRELESLPA
ncbi:MAG TPA: alpha/beta hydrolase [Nevskiaceae bacterium]|nr:alpha/beta hydrolase [Nevskiaceae bacterium]